VRADDVLQTCIDEVLAGRQTPAECAAHYPQVAGLKADLKTALSLRAMQAQTLSAAADQRIEARLRHRARALKAAEPLAGRAQRPAWNRRWAAGLALAATLLLGGISTAAAAGASNPGDLLYGVKRADESAQVFLSPPSRRATVYLVLARHRLDELSVVLQRAQPDAGLVSRLSDDLTGQTAEALALVDAAPVARQADILSTLAAMTDQQQAILAAAEDTAPIAAQAGLQRALQASAAGHARAVERLAQVLGSPKPKSSPTATQTPAASMTITASKTHSPPGQTNVPPGQTQVPPGQTHVPPGQTHVPPGQTQVPPGQTHVPAGQTQVPPGQTQIPLGQQKTPRPTKAASGGDQ
jgi:Domain of unknown function (DUF5667)